MMARNDPKQTVNNNGKIKFRVIEFEMEGGNDRIAEGLRTLAQAVARSSDAPVSRTIAGPRARVAPTLDAGTDTFEEDAIDDSVEEEQGDMPGESTVSSGNPTSKPRRKPVPKAPRFLSNLNLAEAAVKLEAFIKEKDPKDTQEKYVVIAEWFKEHFSTEEIGADHIFTAYKYLGWQAQLPPDTAQPLRDLKYKKTWLDSGSAKGLFKINWSGTNWVNKMGSSSAE